MTLIPIVGREMRGASRQPFTYHVRTLAAALSLVALLMFIGNNPSASGLGGELFQWLHVLLFCAIWLLVPFLTADTISRERREGTLSLLFLTSLRAREIVLAKSVAEALRAMTLWFAIVPVVSIPLLLGGVTLGEALFSVQIMLSSVCWALAAGLLASAWNRVWLRAMAAAMVLAAVFLLIQALLAGVVIMPAISAGPFQPSISIVDIVFDLGLSVLLNINRGWTSVFRFASMGQMLWAASLSTMLALLILALAVIVAGWKTNRSWRDAERSRRQIWIERVFCTPVLWLGFLRAWLRRNLERNPVGWLEQRRWSGRLVTWAWLAIVISFTTAMLTEQSFYRSYGEMLRPLSWMLAVTVALTAAGSFRRERDNGVLELLLVSPLGERSLVWGRLRGIWLQFLPAAGLLFGIWFYFESIFDFGFGGNRHPLGNARIAHAFLTLVSMSVAGLFFSICCRSFIPAVVSTLLVGFFAPVILSNLFKFMLALALGVGWSPSLFNSGLEIQLVASFVIQIMLAVFFWRSLVFRLRLRRFPLSRPSAL